MRIVNLEHTSPDWCQQRAALDEPAASLNVELSAIDVQPLAHFVWFAHGHEPRE